MAIEFEREFLAKLLKITGGNMTQAAKLAKRNRTQSHKLLPRHHPDPIQDALATSFCQSRLSLQGDMILFIRYRRLNDRPENAVVNRRHILQRILELSPLIACY